MAHTAKIPARSLHGCWTCRLRKKKCDESRPVCLVCASLQLTCHGYGPRPEWMDNEIMHRDEASRIKRIVSRTKPKNRRRQLHPSSQSTSQLLHDISGGVDLLSTEMVSLPGALLPSSVYQHQGSIPYNGSPYQASGIDLSPFIDPTFDLPSYAVAFSPSFGRDSLQNLKSSSFLEATVLLDANLPVMVHDNDTTCATENELQGSAFQHESHDSEEVTYNCQVASSAQVSNLGGEIENSLFMYYLDEIFYIQYPFYYSRGRQGRGWLYSILRRAKSAYYATLALCEYRLLSTLPRNNDTTSSLDRPRTQNNHYDLAVQELQALLQSSYVSDTYSTLDKSLDILTALLQLLFWELFNGRSENWQTHLRTACNFIPKLLQERIVPPISCSTSPAYTSDHLYLLNLRSEDDCAIDFLLGSFISLDIISCASTRSAPFLDINHFKTLDILQVPLESLIGCRNSVMSLILEISLLENWKKEAQGAHKLSFVDLVRRGGQIKERLRQELVTIENTPSRGPPLYNPSGIIQTPAPTDISKIFVHSAITYLHVVISGAYPQLPEIIESVSETIGVFKGLKDPKLLRSVIWPFCITGCLALEKEYGFFRDLVSKANITQVTTETCFRAYEIMEECWKARITCPDACDWTMVMKKCGYNVLLT